MKLNFILKNTYCTPASHKNVDILMGWLNAVIRETIFLFYALFYNLSLDNGPRYHHSGFLLYLAEVNGAFNINLVEYNRFEAGEGKS